MEEKYIKEALKEARKAEKIGEVPIGCVIVKDDKIIARAYNKRQTSQIATKHAEIIAIEKACKKLGVWHLVDCEIYVTLEPCLMCAGAIINSRIKKVCYGAYDDKNEEFRDVYTKNNLNHKVEVKGGILQKECADLISNFFKNKR